MQQVYVWKNVHRGVCADFILETRVQRCSFININIIDSLNSDLHFGPFSVITITYWPRSNVFSSRSRTGLSVIDILNCHTVHIIYSDFVLLYFNYLKLVNENIFPIVRIFPSEPLSWFTHIYRCLAFPPFAIHDAIS